MTEPVQIDVRVDHVAWQALLEADPEAFARRIVTAAAQAERASGEVSIALSDDATIQALNAQWRGKDAPTNVLSFPAPAGGEELGDLILALETVREEARAQGKSGQAHAAHLLTHGFLHLLGYDHERDEDAEDMEGRERTILARLGYGDPYAHEREARA